MHRFAQRRVRMDGAGHVFLTSHTFFQRMREGGARLRNTCTHRLPADDAVVLAPGHLGVGEADGGDGRWSGVAAWRRLPKMISATISPCAMAQRASMGPPVNSTQRDQLLPAIL